MMRKLQLAKDKLESEKNNLMYAIEVILIPFACLHIWLVDALGLQGSFLKHHLDDKIIIISKIVVVVTEIIVLVIVPSRIITIIDI